jgi:hypothetical protein
MSRPKIKRITIEIEGRKEPLVLKGKQVPAAIFISDDSVRWLGALYDIYGKGKLSKKKANAALGAKRAASLLGEAETIPINSELVNNTWNTAEELDILPAMVIKRPNCTLEYYP